MAVKSVSSECHKESCIISAGKGQQPALNGAHTKDTRREGLMQ